MLACSPLHKYLSMVQLGHIMDGCLLSYELRYYDARISFYVLLYLFICVYVREWVVVCVGVYAMCVWRSKDSLQALVLPCHSVGPRDTVQDTGVGNKQLYPLSHLISLTISYIKNKMFFTLPARSQRRELLDQIYESKYLGMED